MQNEGPLISVIMSVFNAEKYLEDSITSILNQSYIKFEFIIIDDGSSDNSKNIILKFMKIDYRIKFIKQKNMGLTKSLNKGIKISKGDYIARHDADDISRPKRLEIQVKAMINNSIDLCCCRTWLIENKRSSPRINYFLPKKYVLLFKNPFVHGTFLIKKSILIEIGGYDEDYQFAQDYKLICDLYLKKYKIRYLWDVLYETRTSLFNISNLKRKEQKIFANKIRQNYIKNYFKIT